MEKGTHRLSPTSLRITGAKPDAKCGKVEQDLRAYSSQKQQPRFCPI